MLIYEDDPLLLLFATFEDLAAPLQPRIVIPLQPGSKPESEKPIGGGTQGGGRVIPIDRKKARDQVRVK
ncbi:MAG: hypothetical protein ABSD38_01995 [Syntrophorhabdales bacterium]|jgi:hypothetical protein